MKTAKVTVRTAQESDKEIWDTHATHPLQSWAWGEFRLAMGVDVVRLIVEKNNKIHSVWLITFHPIPHTTWTVGYFPKGPMPDSFMLTALAAVAKEKNAISIQLEPDIDAHHSVHTNDTLVPAAHPLFTKYTFVVDLAKPEDELLKNLHPKTRYNIKVAQKHGVEIKEDNSDQAFNAYLALNQETTTRQGFYAHSTHYHKTMWKLLYKAGIAHLFVASHQEEILATWIVFVWGKTLYYPYGASSRLHRETMAPTLLLWELIRWAKKHKLEMFDLWGALGPTPDPSDPWFGFHRFKQGFNPNLVEYVGSFDLVVKPFLYKLYIVANTARWFFLKLARH